MPAAERLYWHGEALPCAGLDAILDGRRVGPLRWRRQDGCWQAQVDLGTLPAGSLCIPSLILGQSPIRRYRMQLQWGAGNQARLAVIHVTAAAEEAHDWPAGDHRRVGTPGAAAEAGIDCVEAIDTLQDLRLLVEVDAEGAPADSLLLVSRRPRLLLEIDDDGSTAPTLAVPAHSQMTLEPTIARHVCSPVSVAMVLGSLNLAADPHALARDSRHPTHQMFGIWPANMAAAWRCGAGGVVRSFDHAGQAAALLAAGHPIVASLRFEAGELPAAPLPRSGGHLMVLRGMDADSVCVNDPAAATPEEVTRQYPRAAFLRAWLRDRGVGYVLWATSPGERQEDR